jgi:parallel beta helix pectate lyase-like protein
MRLTRILLPVAVLVCLLLSSEAIAQATVHRTSGTHRNSPAKRHHPRRHRHPHAHKRARIAAAHLLTPKGRARETARVPGISGVVYFVSAVGSDSNSGTSPGQAWRSVGRVNAARLAPGDGVLFQGGATFSDQALMPSVSGTASQPIVFGSYGQGKATISQGAWFVQSNLAFEQLAFSATFYGGSEAHGSSNHITLDRVSIALPGANSSLGLYSNGNDWVIQNSTIQNTGLSGMLLNGDHYLITANTLQRTGLDTTNGYNNHGIYLDASDATITNNTITSFAESAISVRYRNSTITANNLSGGQIGIDFYQTDTTPGHSYWTNNTITNTSVAGLFVCGTAESCNQPLESFTITQNTLKKTTGTYLNLQPTSGTYSLVANSLG